MSINSKVAAIKKFTSTVLWLSLVFTTSLADANSTEEEYEQRLRELRHAITHLQRQLTKVKDNRSNLQGLLQKSEVDIGNLTKKIDVIEEALAREKKQLVQLQTKRSQLEFSRNYQQKQIFKIIRAGPTTNGPIPIFSSLSLTYECFVAKQ